MNNSEIKSCYKGYLHSAFAAQKYDNDQISCMLNNFDETCKTTELETAFALTLDAYGSEDVQRACKTVSEYIAREMGKFSQSHKGIPTQGRLKQLINRLNTNIQNLAGVTVNGVSLSQEELDAVKVNMPHCMQSKVFESVASVQNSKKNRGCDKLTLEIRF